MISTNSTSSLFLLSQADFVFVFVTATDIVGNALCCTSAMIYFLLFCNCAWTLSLQWVDLVVWKCWLISEVFCSHLDEPHTTWWSVIIWYVMWLSQSHGYPCQWIMRVRKDWVKWALFMVSATRLDVILNRQESNFRLPFHGHRKWHFLTFHLPSPTLPSQKIVNKQTYTRY